MDLALELFPVCIHVSVDRSGRYDIYIYIYRFVVWSRSLDTRVFVPIARFTRSEKAVTRYAVVAAFTGDGIMPIAP